uniref:HEAT repeat-containing protein 5B n=1 Tax=Panagrellus redivivus TaxID=6233 RepID=A0A7E4VHX8_PANRE
MEQSNSLLLNEEALRQCADLTKPFFIYEWLRYLDRILPVTQKADIKTCQAKLVAQLTDQIQKGWGAPTRQLLARCMAQVFTIADAYDMFQTINLCTDVLKAKEDASSTLAVKLTALTILGAIYESIGRMVGRSYEEAFQLMIKWLKSADSSTRTEILNVISKLIHGLGNAAFSVHKDLYKQLSKSYLTDRVMSVRAAAVGCLFDLVSDPQSPVYTNDLDAISTLCLKSLEGANYEVRLAVARVFAKLAATSVAPKTLPGANNPMTSSSTIKLSSVEDVFNCLGTDFLRGGIGGFLKSSSNGATAGGHKEIRVGLAYAYVEVVRELGASWLERNLPFFIRHLLDVISKCGPLAFSNNPAQTAEVVHMRRCVSFIFRHTLGQILSEPSQLTACKFFGEFLNDYINSFDCLPDSESERLLSAEIYSSAQATVVALLEISALVRQIGTAVTPLFVEASGIMEPVFASLQHPVLGARLAAAWCLRCVTSSVPSQRTPLIDRCINRLSKLEHLKKSPEAISGYSLALAALLAGAADCKMGIPFGKAKQVFAIAEDMIKTASQTCKLALQKRRSGWLLISAVTTMKTPFVRHNLSRLLLLWKYSFPKVVEEANNEKGRGDVFTWECTLESRAGALASMCSFVTHCQELLTEDVVKLIVNLIQSSLATMALVADLLFTYGVKLRHSIYTFRIRLYTLLSRLQLKLYEHLFSVLLRELVADITLSDNSQAITTSSLTASLCSSMEHTLLAGWVRDTTQSALEGDLHVSSTAPIDIAIEHDPYTLITTDSKAPWPEPLPVHVASIDLAIDLFGRVYPLAPAKHKLQLTNHFLNAFKGIKNANRLVSIQANVLGAVLCAMRSMGETRTPKLEGEELHKANVNLVLPLLNHERVLLRCLAIETLGHLTQAVGEAVFVAGNAQYCFDQLRSTNDQKSRSGYALALGCLHNHVGSLGSGQHLNTGVSVLIALAQEWSSPMVQSWAILSLSLVAATGGGMFQGYRDPSLSLCLRLLAQVSASNSEVIISVGRLVSALITSVGPELSMTLGTMDNARSSFLIASSMMFEHPDPLVKAEALGCFQQLHLFAPRFVQLDRLVTNICHLLSNPHLVLRKAAVACLRQLLQREVKEVREHAQSLIPVGMMDKSKAEACPLPETGLEGALFELLDTETDPELRVHIKEALNFLVQATSGELLSHWLTMCKDILASTSGADVSRSTIVIDEKGLPAAPNASGGGLAGGADDEEGTTGDDDDSLAIASAQDSRSREKVLPRWPSRVFAFEIVRKLMGVCDTERAHLDFALAKELQTTGAGRPDYLVLHLADLVRMSFMGATSDNDELRLAGLASLQDVIDRFATVPDPGFPGDVILKQFQAQVGAALRPAFDPETPSHVTAAACQVCSTWIGSGVARDLNDLRRVNQLLVSSLGKLKHGSINTQLYNESAATLEKLAILKAWAEVYIVAVKEQESGPKDKEAAGNGLDDEGSHHENLLTLVNPELNSLIGHWLAVLRDSAMLTLPAEFANQLPENGGAFFTPESAESCKDYYYASWPPILLATSIWLNRNNFEVTLPESSTGNAPIEPWLHERRETRFALLLGMCCESLCSNRSYIDSDRVVQLCLSTLRNLIDCQWARLELMRDVRVAVEMLNILHRLVLTRDNLATQKMCADVVLAVLAAARTAIETVSAVDVVNGNVDAETAVYQGYPGGEGIDGFDSSTSLTFATLEIALCLLVRQIPQINSALMKSKSSAPLHFRKYARLPSEACELVRLGVQLLVQIPELCSPEGSIVLLPTVFYLVLGVLRESSRIDVDSTGDLSTGHVSAGAAAAMVAIRQLVSYPPTKASPETYDNWSSVVRSSLLSMLNMVEGSDARVDKSVVMLAATVMTTTLPSSFPIGAPLFHKHCRLLKQCIQHPVAAIRLKALQSLNSIFGKKDICAPYIRELAPLVFDKIRPFIMPTAEAAEPPSPTLETDLPVLVDISEIDAAAVQEAIKAIETILRVSPTPEKQIMFINLLLRCLVRFLVPNPARDFLDADGPTVKRLHDFAFQRINTLAPAYPEAFKTVIASCPAIKQRIEHTAQLISRSSQLSQQAAILQNQQKAAAVAREAAAATAKPTIELKMDFAAKFAS